MSVSESPASFTGAISMVNFAASVVNTVAQWLVHGGASLVEGELEV